MLRVPSYRAAFFQRIRSPGRPATLFALVVLAAIWATFAAYAINLWNAIEEEAHEELYGAQNVMRAHTSSAFRAAGTMLNITEHWLSEDLDGSSEHTLDSLGSLISDLQGQGHQLITVGLIDSDDSGFWRVNRGEIFTEKVYVGDREYIAALRDKPPGSRFFGEPIIGRKSGLRTVPLAVRAPPNALGVKYIVAYLTDEIFSNAFSHLTDIAPAIVGITRDDGLLLFVWPQNEKYKGTKVEGFSDTIVTQTADKGVAATLAGLGDSGPLLAAFGPVPEQPLRVFTSFRQSDLTALFWRMLALPLVLALLTTLVIGWLGIWLRHLMEREADKSEKLSVALTKAEAANVSKSEFLANMSHELRTPLNAIIGFSDVLSSEMFGPLGAKQYRDYTRDIGNAGQHLLGIITQILDTAKIDSGTFADDASAADLGENIEACLRLLSARALDRGIEINCGNFVGLPLVWIDPGHLRQVVLNLVGNAIKFSNDGGRIDISAVVVPKNQLQITIRDDGIGIKPEAMSMLFQPFSQVEKSLSRQYGGVGLGLVNSRQLVEAYGGKIWLESKYGVGTTAICLLQIAKKISDAPQS